MALFRYLTAGLNTLLVALLLAAVPATAAATDRTITNVARLSWEEVGARLERDSNQVDLVVRERVTIPIETLLVGIGTSVEPLLSATCRSLGAGGATGNGSAWPGTILTPTSEIRAGQPLAVAIDRPQFNADPSVAERIRVILSTSTGDREEVWLTESAPNSGRFLGLVATGLTPSPANAGDCTLTVRAQEELRFELADPGSPPFASANVDILVDPYGIAFDSRDGTPVSGVRLTLVDVASGQPAQVFGDDGVSTYPSTMVTGGTVVDSSGVQYIFPPGDYRFPLVRPGTYRLLVEAPSPYAFPSAATAVQLAALRRPDGLPFTIAEGSYGGLIALSSPAPVRIDIPLDRPVAALTITKTASRNEAERGDIVQYRITITNPDGRHASRPIVLTDRIPEQMRYRPSSSRLNGGRVGDPDLTAGRTLRFSLPSLPPGGSANLTYLLDVRPDARAGDALNRAQAEDGAGRVSNIADALVRVRGDTLADRITVIGQVTEGGECSGDDRLVRRGVPGIRVLLEDGSYAVTDLDGRYHFEGVSTGTHVVQIDRATLAGRWEAIDCAANVRSGGRGFSRFVDGAGGMLKRVDFRLHPLLGERVVASVTRPAVASDAHAAGDRDWLAGQQPGIEWLFPTAQHNPRAPVTRVVIKHLPDQTVRLALNGKPVDPIAFEGTLKTGAGVAVSQWRGIPLAEHRSSLTADVLGPNGLLVKQLERNVVFSNVPARAELVTAKSKLTADGVQRPVIVLRMTDRDGRPVHHGAAGEFELPEPYYAAMEADAQQARQLAGLERARPTWRVEGEDGLAYVELEPTTASGTVALRFTFKDGEHVREQRLQAWLSPGDRPWTVVGLAEGTVGFNALDAKTERLGRRSDKTVVDGRLALYAKGKIRGRWLMTLAYDTDKKSGTDRFGGVIDPDEYYTVYADRSERRYDAASVRKLYLKLERPQFYALFGDYETGLDEPRLARYVRSMNGFKAEYGSERVSAVAFAADTPFAHRRDEIQGDGVSGPYRLRSRSILANTERVVIEVRDRLRSDRVVETRLLTRHIDYDIDYRAGTLLFREPVLSRSSSLDPQFIVVDYEVYGVARRELNAGGRFAWRSADQKVQLAATAVHDNDGDQATNLAGIDLRFRPSAATEFRAEIGASRRHDVPGTKSAWLIEAEHHDGRLDLLAYARQQDTGFGVGQLNLSESGTQKFGGDARIRLTRSLTASGSAWHENYLGSDARRTAARGLLEYKSSDLSLRAGIVAARDTMDDGRSANSTLLQLGATKRLFSNRLELDAQSELPLSGQDDSIDFPARHRLGGRFAVNRNVALVGTYEIAKGDRLSARTTRLGFDIAPWAGGRIALSGNIQDIAEYGHRSFAAYGLSQSLVLSPRWSVDVSLDGNRTIGDIEAARVLNPRHPVANGGFVGDGSSLTEDFTAVTAGATYRSGRWSTTGRAEYRAGDREDRQGLIIGALRQIGEGQAMGGAFNWFRAKAAGGAETQVMSGRLSWAHRPSNDAWSFLDKLEIREDQVAGATAGAPTPLGTPLSVEGRARSRRIINSLSLNFSAEGGKVEGSLFWGARYASDRFGREDVRGLSNILAADLRFDLSSKIELGSSASLRHSVGRKAVAMSFGPQVGLRPFANGWLVAGWNLVGYQDRDFAEDRYTRSGPYVAMRLKIDELSLAALGLGR